MNEATSFACKAALDATDVDLLLLGLGASYSL
jgi:hypothetical protein